MTLKNNRNRLIPFLWIYLISGVTAAILFYGFKAAESRQKHTLQLEQAEQAEETLATLAFGSRFQPYLTRISADLKKTLISHINNSARDKNPQRKFLSANFPENELWVFKSRKETSKPEAVFYPSNSRTSRSGMINLFSALNSLDFSTGKDKLADFLFGPGLKISTLIKRKNRPTRIIYQNKHHYLLWDTIDSQGKNVGGFFLLIPDGPELTRFAMQRTADRLSSLDGPAIQFAGFLNLFSKDVNTICHKDFVLNSGLNEELKKIAANSSLKNLETSSLPYGKKVENWKIYTKAIAQSTHLAFVFIKEDLAKTRTFSISSFISTAYILVGVILLFIFIANCQLPPLNLRIRFFLLFSALASIPFSMLMISAQVYLEELRITLMRETRQNLQDSIG